MTAPSDYYAFRGGAKRPHLDYAELQRLLSAVFKELEDKGWFQAELGKDCVDDRNDVGAIVLERLGHHFWPFSSSVANEEEQWVFTILEFAYGIAAKPVTSYVHDWNNCGVHVTGSDREAGRHEFRERINALLVRYSTPYELRENGEIWAVTPAGFEEIEPVPTGEPSIDDRVRSAIRAFRRFGANDDDRRHAIHDLADVFEYLRSTVGTQLLSKDEGELFNIANNFGIRHHNPNQKTEYDSGVWLGWIFYTYLNTVDLVTKLLTREDNP